MGSGAFTQMEKAWEYLFYVFGAMNSHLQSCCLKCLFDIEGEILSRQVITCTRLGFKAMYKDEI